MPPILELARIKLTLHHLTIEETSNILCLKTKVEQMRREITEEQWVDKEWVGRWQATKLSLRNGVLEWLEWPSIKVTCKIRTQAIFGKCMRKEKVMDRLAQTITVQTDSSNKIK